MTRVDDDGVAFAGSQLQTQLYVNRRREVLDESIRGAFPELADASFEWRSPLAEDRYAEYYGSAFLKRLSLDEHLAALKEFWPSRGPQWDALALVLQPDGETGVVLAEGKSRVNEMLKGSAASSEEGSDNRRLIESALEWTQEQLGVHGRTGGDWCGPLYQNANRLAHHCWLRSRGVNTWFVHLLFTDDPIGPASETDWKHAIDAANKGLGIEGKTLDGVGHVLLPAGTREQLVGPAEVANSPDVKERHLPGGVWERLTSNPADAPLNLALAAVDHWGQHARDYAERVRREHPERHVTSWY